MMDTRKLFALFDRYAHSKSYSTAFIEMLDFFLIPFRVYATTEEQQEALDKITGHPLKQLLADLLEELGNLSEGFHDPLGELYMQKVSNGRNGQYFSPSHICDLMAALTTAAIQDGQSVLDPACGSGRMLLAVGKINRNALLYGADIDGVCAKMAVANMLLQSLSGEIAHMDSLGNDFYTGYRLGTVLYGGYFHPQYKVITDPQQSDIWIKRPMKKETITEFTKVVDAGVAPKQGTLF